ncbi:MAG: DUF4304 domain-containing protein [Chitinophaga sp.]|uniref:DUF4304 domain-containing protein n=1 Tax=Chitinophaga sp. TaxID=1869181 RepID=UPI001B280ACF|nr:DUF4304 domain-containing protein [Chitinophaga sp.]MBO9728355.1 DUF4304 domain-containing protein [Chitinophaga sp.]
MKTSLDLLIADTIAPLLKKNGFNKKGLNFYKTTNGLVFLINIQKSQGNIGNYIKFYINCGIHSTEIDRVIGAKENEMPKEYECYYRARISDITRATTDGYMAETVNATVIIADLQQVLALFESITTSDELAQLMINKNGLNNYKELFTYLLLTNQEQSLKSYATHLFHTFGAEKRWSIFENQLNDVLQNNKKTYQLSNLIG